MDAKSDMEKGCEKMCKLDLDFGMPDPYPKDGTGRFAHVGRTCVAHV